MSDFNQDGHQYEIFGQNVHSVIGGYLPEDIVIDFVKMKSQLAGTTNAEGELTEVNQGAFGVLYQIDAFLLQAERLSETVFEIQKASLSENPNPEIPCAVVKEANQQNSQLFSPPALIWVSSQKLEMDFDNLLSRATSALERFAKLVCVSLGVTPVKSFYGLRQRLVESGGGDSRTQTLIDSIDESMAALSGTLISDGQGKSLRNILTHQSSVTELLYRGLSINWLSDGRILAFDLEVGGYPVIGTAHRIISAFLNFLYKGLKALLAMNSNLESVDEWDWLPDRIDDDFIPQWENPMIHYESFIDDSGEGEKVSIVCPKAGGLRIHTQPLRREVFDLAVLPKKVKSN